ncbi:MAG TPA: YIP1 family protein [Terriglobales bacterium]|jgi:hypothetical protein
MDTTQVTPAPEAKPLSQGERIIDTFIAPSKTFTDLKRSASWWLPFLIIAVVTVAFAYVVDTKITFRQVAENQNAASPKATQRMEQMPSDQRARTINAQAVGTKYVSYAFPIILLILYAIFAGLYLATFKFGLGADLKFKVSLAVVVYGALPQVLKTLLAMVSMAAGANPESFVLQNPVATNPGYFLSQADSPFLFGILSAVDVFMIWSLIITAIGYSCVTKVKRSTSLIVLFGWYLAVTLFFASLGAMFS